MNEVAPHPIPTPHQRMELIAKRWYENAKASKNPTDSTLALAYLSGMWCGVLNGMPDPYETIKMIQGYEQLVKENHDELTAFKGIEL